MCISVSLQHESRIATSTCTLEVAYPIDFFPTCYHQRKICSSKMYCMHVRVANNCLVEGMHMHRHVMDRSSELIKKLYWNWESNRADCRSPAYLWAMASSFFDRVRACTGCSRKIRKAIYQNALHLSTLILLAWTTRCMIATEPWAEPLEQGGVRAGTEIEMSIRRYPLSSASLNTQGLSGYT